MKDNSRKKEEKINEKIFRIERILGFFSNKEEMVADAHNYNAFIVGFFNFLYPVLDYSAVYLRVILRYSKDNTRNNAP